ncbi:casparian strip membrane protein 1-like [Alnus glutinosa]|uniref:casparian strip membrane protein 1-like n=1 Tax=Alnus glutinosa TaxID=3517 RepID=UPI002D777F6A|nr:casparian strip membrane protein 1-like [Alnus glutinosa]
MKAAAGPVPEAGGEASSTPQRVINRGLSIMDLVLRIIAAVGTLASAVAVGTTDQTLPFFTQFFQFTAQYNDIPTFTFFMIANSIVCAYLVLSLPLSVFHIIRSRSGAAKKSRIILLIFDTVMLALLTAGASAAAAIVYLAYNGNASANWSAFCQQFDSFCERISGSLIGSFGGILLLLLLIFTLAVAISRH